MNVMTTLIFVILIVSRLHAFFLAVVVPSFLQVLVAVGVIPHFQHRSLPLKAEDCHSTVMAVIVALFY